MRQRIIEEPWPIGNMGKPSLQQYQDIHPEKEFEYLNEKFVGMKKHSNGLKENIPLKNQSHQPKRKIIECHPYQLKQQECGQCKKLKEQLEESYNNLQGMSQSLTEINQCYSEKISILEDTISRYAERYEELLLEKKQAIDKTMAEKEKFQEQHIKLIDTLESVLREYEDEKRSREILESRIEELEERQRQRERAMKNNEEIVEKMMAERVREIEQLKEELSMLNAEGETEREEESCAIQKEEKEEKDENYFQIQLKRELSEEYQAEKQPEHLQDIAQQDNDQSPSKSVGQNTRKQFVLRQITNEPRTSEEETRVKALPDHHEETDHQSIRGA